MVGSRRGGVAIALPQQAKYESARRELRQAGISERAVNALVAGGIYTINGLQGLSESELTQIPGVGPITVRQLRGYLRKQKTSLTGDAPLISVKFAEEILTEIDKWAFRQKGVVSRAEAVRRLVELGLAHDQKEV